MIENKNLCKILAIFIALEVIVEIVIVVWAYKYNEYLANLTSNLLLGILGSTIVSCIIAIITYNHKKEETEEEFIKNLVLIYNKMVMFKCTFYTKQDKDIISRIGDIQKEINDYLVTIHDIEYDLVYKLKTKKPKDAFLLGKYNKKQAEVLSRAIKPCEGGIKFKNAKGIDNVKNFTESFNERLHSIRDFLEFKDIGKYKYYYDLSRMMDYRFKDIESKSEEKIVHKV